ncbi:16S rRNA (guanine(527)-N(7))-methyltransferase RsmG [Eionea flava]
MGITIDDKKVDQLLTYLGALVKWNKAYNLSAIREPIAMVEKHLLDSLTLLPYFNEAIQQSNTEDPLRQIIDVGTGGGLPGIPLAIIFPDTGVTLLDSNGKKTRFLFQVKTELGLSNVNVENARVESYLPDQLFDIVVSRAFASLHDMVTGTQHLLRDGGQYWAMKGIYPEKELSDCKKHAIVEAFYPLQVPNVEGERHLLILNKV